MHRSSWPNVKTCSKFQTPLCASNHRRQQRPARPGRLLLLRNLGSPGAVAQVVGAGAVADRALAVVHPEADDRAARPVVLERFTSSTRARPINPNRRHGRSKSALAMVFRLK